jgi:hypothetical protein
MGIWVKIRRRVSWHYFWIVIGHLGVACPVRQAMALENGRDLRVQTWCARRPIGSTSSLNLGGIFG